MAFIESSFPPLDVWVRKQYLYDHQKGQGEYQRGRIISVKCLTGQVPLFQVLLDNGVLRDKLPSAALIHFDREIEPDKVPDQPFDHLCLWNSFSKSFSVVMIDYLGSCQVDVLLKDKQWYAGEYYCTIQWSGDTNENADLSLSEVPHEHKSHHVILLDNGNIALQPNNRIRWVEPSFVTKPFPERPDYKVTTEVFNAEAHGKWATEDSDRMFYTVDNPEN